MSKSTQAPTTVSNIGVAMFTVADQDAAMAFYTEKLGFEVRSDSRFGENNDKPGGSAIGVETNDVLGEHARLSAIGGIDLDPEPMRAPGAPLMFMLRDPDGNSVVVVEAPPAA
jgi:catechol 2,3-dioxygenase-like lactoylglutathione lyase family enzyme